MKKNYLLLTIISLLYTLPNNAFSGIIIYYSQHFDKIIDIMNNSQDNTKIYEIHGNFPCKQNTTNPQDISKVDILFKTKGVDYEHMFQKDTGTSSYEIVFAKDEIILAFSHNKKLKNITNKENWTSIIKKNTVKVGFVSDFSKPCNITPLITLKLAEKAYRYTNFYNIIYSKALLYKNNTLLIDALKNDKTDVALIYKSTAIINGLEYMELPGIVNLSENKYEKLYRETSISLKLSDNQEATYSGDCIYLSLLVNLDSIHKPEVLSFIKNLLSDSTREKINNQGFDTDFYPEFHGNLKNLDFSLRGITKYTGF